MLVKKLRETALATAAAGALVLGMGVGSANAISVGGIEFEEGATFKSSRIYENIVAGAGSTLTGIGIVNDITDGSSTTYWQNGDNSRELTFEFGGYFAERVTIIGGGTLAIIDFSGGFVNMYVDTAQNFSVTSGQAQDIINATDGDLWLSLRGATTGVVCDDATCISQDERAITLTSVISISGDIGTVSGGSGTGFLDVFGEGGLANLFFDTNTGPSGQDLRLGSNFSTTLQDIDFPLSGTADIRGEAKIPEPAGLALFGLALIGLAGIRRKRNA